MGQVAVTIKGKAIAEVGETVILEGLTEFRPSVVHLKWQKYLDREYVDIDIHKSKYQGTKNSIRSPKLVLNNLDLEDGGYYRIKFTCTSSVEYSSVHRLRIQPKEETFFTIDIQPDQINGRYYVGEDVIIKANLRNVSRILCTTWQKQTENGRYTIDTSLPKNMEIRNDQTGEYKLTIQNCNELDKGTYFLLAACSRDMEVKSNMIKLDFVKEKPEVIFNHVSKAVYDTMVKYEASIRSCIKHTSTVWRKGEKTIDINSRKFEGSSTVGCHPVLCINNVDEEDEDFYSIHVSNKWGDTTLSKRLVLIGKKPTVCVKLSSQSQKVVYGNAITLQADIKSYPAPSCIRWTRIKNGNNEENIDDIEKFTIDKLEKRCQRLTIKNLEFSDNGNYIIIVTNVLGSTKANLEIKVEASQMIFISGPVVVSPRDNIKFLTMFTTNQNCLNAKWFKIKKYSKKEINLGSTKYSISNTSDGTKTQAFDVVQAGEEDSAGYQLTIDNVSSNVINTFVDDSGKFCTETQGNFYRCFALQTVCADALRNVFDNLPDAFEDKIKKFKKKCRGEPKLEDKLKSLEKNKPSSSKDLDVTLMCAIIQNLNYIANPIKGWGREPDKNDIGIADDLERIRSYRNYLCHKSSLELETNDFNKAALDIIWAIRRLSKNDVKILEDICDIMNKVITRGKAMDEMIVQIKIIEKETNEWKDFFRIKEFNDDIHLIDREIKFHQIHDSSILIQDNFTSACNRSLTNGLCFMERPLQLQEKVHIRGSYWMYRFGLKHLTVVNIGLTDINPDTIHDSEEKKQIIRDALKPVQFIGKQDYHRWGNFHLCITLCPNATLSLCLHDTEELLYHYQTVSDYHPLWLVIELEGCHSMWISHV